MTLLELLHLLKKRLKLVIVLPLVCALAVGGYSFVAMKNTYTASVSMYVLVQHNNANSNTLSSDLSASQMVTNDVATLLKSDCVVLETAKALDLEDLKGYTTSRVLTLEVTGTDPQRTAVIANKMAEEVSGVACEVMNVDSVNVVDSAKVPTSPSGPKRPLWSLSDLREPNGNPVNKNAAYDKQYLAGCYGADPYLTRIEEWA